MGLFGWGKKKDKKYKKVSVVEPAISHMGARYGDVFTCVGSDLEAYYAKDYQELRLKAEKIKEPVCVMWHLDHEKFQDNYMLYYLQGEVRKELRRLVKQIYKPKFRLTYRPSTTALLPFDFDMEKTAQDILRCKAATVTFSLYLTSNVETREQDAEAFLALLVEREYQANVIFVYTREEELGKIKSFENWGEDSNMEGDYIGDFYINEKLEITGTWEEWPWKSDAEFEDDEDYGDNLNVSFRYDVSGVDDVDEDEECMEEGA
jgi:hypothetical protein